MLSNNDWLAAGLEVLATEGAQAITIERLCRRLGVSKGSFHHHFDGIAGFRQALLAAYEQRVTSAFDQAIEAFAGQPQQATLLGLTAGLNDPGSTYDPRFEVAMRSWAYSDPGAQAVQRRIDEARIAALEQVWVAITEDPEQARVSALLPYLVAVGASLVVPPIEADELRRVYEVLQRLVPPVDPAAG